MPERIIGDVGISKTEDGSVIIELDAIEERVTIRDSSAASSIHLDGDDARLSLGASGGNDGDVFVHDSDGNETIHLGGNDARLQLGRTGGNDGDVFVHDLDGNETIHLGGDDARLRLGKSGGNDGDVFVHDSDGNETIHLGGNDARLQLGRTGGNDGDVYVHDSDGNETIHLGGDDARLRLGASGDNDGDIFVHDQDGNETIKLGGNAGDIFLSSADCAEDFDAVDPEIEPGTVVSLDDDGSLRRSTSSYDPRVAGVVSGAGEYDPGVVLDRQGDRVGRVPIALVGKVMCKADTSNGPLRVGDLLTTSEEPGRAMRATDPSEGFGAVIGKALGSLDSGRDLVPVLASLR